MTNHKDYPYANLSIPCPASSDRLTAFFRLFCAIPVLIIFCLIVGCNMGQGIFVGYSV